MRDSENKQILIVDNDEEEARTLEAMLQQAGYASSTTWSGLEALELLKSKTYDILLVSSYLPDLYVGDFFERLNHLSTRPCTILMQEDHDSASTLQTLSRMIEERKLPAR
ncbi:MAG: response regulator [Terriglobales bacterium]|jgi:DNA-binding response OmpR family regulator